MLLALALGLLLSAVAVASLWFAAPLGAPSWSTLALALAAAGLLGLALVLALVRGLRRRRRVRAAPQDPSGDALREHFDGELRRVREALEADSPAPRPRWVLLLGPSGAGKSAALLSSGLRFRPGFGPERLLGARSLQATDRAAFYMTEAEEGTPTTIFVDTSGRYVDGGPADDREWAQLLEHIPADEPLAAIVVVVSAAELLAADGSPHDASPTALSGALRRRVDAVQGRLCARLPVYVVIAKIDALVGVARLADLLELDNLGLEVEVEGPGARPLRGQAERALGELCDDLAVAAFDRLRGAELAVRGELLRSLAALAALRDATADLLGGIFPDHGSEDAPIVRALAWSYAREDLRQPAAPVDPLAAACAAQSGLRPPPAAAPPPSRRRDLALHQLFERLLDDRGLGRPSRRALRARRRRAGLVTGLVVGLAAAAAFMITDAARSNQRLLGQLLGAIQRAAQAPPTPAMAPADLAPLAEVAHTLADYTVDGPPWGLRWGLYQGEGLAEPALTRYRDLVAARVIAPVAAAAEESLAQTTRRSQGAARELSRDAYWQTVRSLRLYLALTTIEGEPPVTEARDWLSEALADSWAELSGRSADERAAPALSAVLVERDLPALAASGALPAGDKRIVERARRLLRRTSRGRLFVEAMTERGLGGEAIRISTFAPAATWLRNNDRKVRPIFTRHGWAEIDALLDCEGRTARPYLRAAAAIDGRMCGEELSALRREYLAAYVREWNQFLDTMHVAEPEGYDPIRAQIEDMTITGGPSVNALEALFKIVADNAAPPRAGDEPWIRAQVHRAQAAAADRRAAHTGDDAVRLALEPFFRYGRPEASAADGETQVSPLQAYFSVLMRISGPLDEYARTQDVAHLEQARKHAGDVFTLLSEEHLPQQDAKWRPVLQRLLEPPIRGLLEEVRRGESDQLTQRWCNEVYLPFEAMKICYPFTKDGACNASASEVAELFHPTTGALWQLYDDALAGRFPFEGDRYAVAVQGYGSRLKLNPKVADLLTRAKELGEVLFPGGAAGPTFSFSIQFQPSTTASKLRLLVDGTTFEYNNNHNDAFRPLTWPGEGGPPGAELVASIRGGEQRVRGEGFWGFFKLLETGDVHQEQRFIRVKMRVGEAKDVHFILNPESGLGTPLFGRLRPDAELMDVFRGSRLKVPSALFLGGMRCAAKGPR